MTQTAQRTMSSDQRMGYQCVCGREFSTQRGRNIHKTKMGCADPSSENQQRSAPADKTFEDLSQDSVHSAENIQADLTDEELVRLVEGMR
ncbi:MAG: hypothetical protein MJA29_07975 [Candidatus Omnitrophica bacterium]|nr:hypothetical protein [Candidatus Omnitrophota bacterium]